jgi:hypothetical protein
VLGIVGDVKAERVYLAFFIWRLPEAYARLAIILVRL